MHSSQPPRLRAFVVLPLASPLVRRRAVAAVKRDVGEDLSELAIVYVFIHTSSEFHSRFSRRAAQGTPQGTAHWGRLLFDYFLLAAQEKVISPGAAPRRGK